MAKKTIKKVEDVVIEARPKEPIIEKAPTTKPLIGHGTGLICVCNSCRAFAETIPQQIIK